MFLVSKLIDLFSNSASPKEKPSAGKAYFTDSAGLMRRLEDELGLLSEVHFCTIEPDKTGHFTVYSHTGSTLVGGIPLADVRAVLGKNLALQDAAQKAADDIQRWLNIRSAPGEAGAVLITNEGLPMGEKGSFSWHHVSKIKAQPQPAPQAEERPIPPPVGQPLAKP